LQARLGVESYGRLHLAARLEVTDRDKDSSLLLYGINYDLKKFYTTGPRKRK